LKYIGTPIRLELNGHIKFLSMDIMCGFKKYSTYVDNVNNIGM
jgi:hypothetical protein